MITILGTIIIKIYMFLKLQDIYTHTQHTRRHTLTLKHTDPHTHPLTHTYTQPIAPK